MKKTKTKRLKVVYKGGLLDAGEPEQKKEAVRRLDRVYDFLFRRVVFGKNERERVGE